MKSIIYFMSGTGNSFRIASWIANLLSREGIAGITVPIEAADPESEITPLEKEEIIIGFLMPVHGFTIPWLMLKALLKFPAGKGKNVFISSTRAGLKFGKIYPPGISGSTMFVAAIILMLKGYRIKWMQSFDMPSNWMSLHPGFKEKNSRAIISRAKTKVDALAWRIISMKSKLISRNTMIEFIWGVVLLPVSLPYLLLGRFGLAKLFFANPDCNGCGSCASNCPVGAIEMKGVSKPRPYWTFRCESCMRCMAYCPFKAVEASQPLLVLYYYASTLPALYIAAEVNQYFAGISGDWHTLLYKLLSIAVYFSSLFLIYLIIFYLLKIKPLNYIFTFTTLTHFYHRYHEPDTEMRDMQ